MAGSALLVDEFFATEDARFLGELFACDAEGKLKAFGAKWASDARPFARRALDAYIADGCDRPHHRPLVKKLWKELEGRGDDEAMGWFLVAFDRLVKRRLIEQGGWRQGGLVLVTRLVAAEDDDDNEDHDVERFSTRTRRYMKRRTWRYFRVLGHRDEARYGKAIRAALARYEDPALATVPQLLDAWGLIHALYHGSDVVVRHPRGVALAEGRELAELTPAPIYPGAWRGVFRDVLALAGGAHARPVRAFAIGLLERDYAAEIAALGAKELLPLLRSPHAEVAAFGIKLLPASKGLDSLPVSDWLSLLAIEDDATLAIACELVAKRLRPDRLSLEQTIDLACARPTPVAELGFQWMKQKPLEGEPALASLSRLLRAANPKIRSLGVRLYVERLEASPHATHQRVRDLFDASDAVVRAEGIAVLERSARFQDDTALWAALAETPYPDVRSFLIRHLAVRQKALLADERRHLWATTLLSVYRGSKEKRRALDQIANRIVARPAEAPALAPLLAITLRSVREAERRAALAAIARAAFRAPALRAVLESAMPELSLATLESA